MKSKVTAKGKTHRVTVSEDCYQIIYYLGQLECATTGQIVDHLIAKYTDAGSRNWEFKHLGEMNEQKAAVTEVERLLGYGDG